MQCVTLTWMRYQMRYHTCYCTFSLIFVLFWAICNELPRVTTKSIKQIYALFLKKIDGNAWQPVANSPKSGNSRRKCMVTHAVASVVTRSSHGNALYYGLTMFVEFETLLYPKLASYMTQLQSDFKSLPTWFFKIN